jgi:hypothetical protein
LIQTTAVNQYVWDLSYIDAPVVRFRDGNADSDYEDSVDNTLYYTTDANHNVTALVKASDGSVAERYTFDAYGKAMVHDAAWSDVAVAPRKGVGLTFNDSASTMAETNYRFPQIVNSSCIPLSTPPVIAV